jgi:hypothetical protein
MRKNIYCVFLFFLSLNTASLYAQDSFRFYINNINMPLNNAGVLADVNIPPEGTLGRYNDIGFLFSGGFWISGYNEDTIWASAVATASLMENFIPGNVGSNQFDPRYKIYVIKKGDPPFGASWQEWAFAVELGAKFYDGDGDSVYNPVDLNGNSIWDPNEDRPDLIGDQLAWCVFNDGQTDRIRLLNSEPVGIEIRQSVFGYNSYLSSQLKNIIFIRYEILNTGAYYSTLDSLYFTAWADADLGNHLDDLVGSDTLNNSGYNYNDGEDAQFGSNPPAFFINILQGPRAYIPGETFIDNNTNGIYDEGIDTPLDSAFNHLGSLFGSEIYPGAKNQPLTSFVHYIASDPVLGDPNTMVQLRNYSTGRHRNGTIINPCNWGNGTILGGINCAEVNPLFWYSGDPETETGWINAFGTDQRMMVNTGHFTLKENEPVTIIIGFSIGQGNSALNSVTAGKTLSQFTQEFYKSNFDVSIVSVEDEDHLISDFQLFQNYPNPFNPITKIKYTIPNVTLSKVEGSLVSLKVFDVLGNEIATLVNEEKHAGSYEVEFDASSLSSGIYFYQLKTETFSSVKKMILIK